MVEGGLKHVSGFSRPRPEVLRWTAAALVVAVGIIALFVGIQSSFGGPTPAQDIPGTGTAGTLQMTIGSHAAAIRVTDAIPGTTYSNTGTPLTITNSGTLPATQTFHFPTWSSIPAGAGVSSARSCPSLCSTRPPTPSSSGRLPPATS